MTTVPIHNEPNIGYKNKVAYVLFLNSQEDKDEKMTPHLKHPHTKDKKENKKMSTAYTNEIKISRPDGAIQIKYETK